MAGADRAGAVLLAAALAVSDFEAWREVRIRGRDWLVKWEPRPLPGQPDATADRRVFAARCGARERSGSSAMGYGFGIFVGPAISRFAGEINLSSVQRGPYQNAYVGYWIDEAVAGHSYVPEAFVVLCRFAFEDLGLHRLQASIIPRNGPSNRVAEKLGLRERRSRPPLPRDQRGLGGPRPLRHHLGGLGGTPGRAPAGMDPAGRVTSADLWRVRQRANGGRSSRRRPGSGR